MRAIILILIAVYIVVISGCVRDGVGVSHTSSKDGVVSSSVAVEVTEDMLKRKK